MNNIIAIFASVSPRLSGENGGTEAFALVRLARSSVIPSRGQAVDFVPLQLTKFAAESVHAEHELSWKNAKLAQPWIKP